MDEPEAGLIHMGARFYDPAAGAFLQTDPVKGSISNPYSMVPYIYALNDPVNLIDPAGEMPSSAWFNQKQREWANTAGKIQSFLRSRGFLGKNGKQLPVTGTYGENTKEAHWNYYLFREAIGDPHNPDGMTDSYYARHWTDSAKEELVKWFAGKGEDVKQLQIFLRNKGYLDGKYVTGYFGAITRDALTKYMYGNKKVSQPSVAKTAGTSTSTQGTGENKSWDQSLGNAMQQQVDKYIAGPLNNINNEYGPVAATGEAVVEGASFVAIKAAALYGATSEAFLATLARIGTYFGDKGIPNIANNSRLSGDSIQKAEEVFFTNGTLRAQFIQNSKSIIPGTKLGDPNVVKALTSNGSNISDWAKMTTQSVTIDGVKVQVHFYMNQVTNEITAYGMKFK